MKEDSANVIVIKSKAFAIRIIKLREYLKTAKHEYDISRQILRSGTSVGANVREAIRGQSKADFGAKMNIALKEASETEYWLELLHEADIIDQKCFDSIITDCRELLRLLTSIVKTTFNSNQNINN